MTNLDDILSYHQAPELSRDDISHGAYALRASLTPWQSFLGLLDNMSEPAKRSMFSSYKKQQQGRARALSFRKTMPYKKAYRKKGFGKKPQYKKSFKKKVYRKRTFKKKPYRKSSGGGTLGLILRGMKATMK